MAEIRPQPQSPALGALARMLGAARDAAGRVRIDSQLLGQTSLADLLSLPGAASLAEDVSYFGPAAMLRPGSGRTLQTFKLDPRVLDAADVALNVSPLGALAAKGAARAARPVARAAGEAVNRAMLTGEGPLATALAPVRPLTMDVPKIKESNYETVQEGPFYRVKPRSAQEARPKDRGVREEVREADTAAGSVGSDVSQPVSDEAIGQLIKDPSNFVRRVADDYSQRVAGHGYQLPEMPPSSLAKQSAIGRTFQLAADGDDSYKQSVFEAYGRRYPELIDLVGAQNYDQLLEAAYRQLAKETADQFHTLPVNMSYHRAGEGNYQSSGEMLKDIYGNRHLYVYQGGDPHDFLNAIDPQTNLNTNEMFRAVHDFYGHAVHGNPFGPKGEEIAYGAHAQMFSPLARMAMASETRGQNSFVNYTPINAELKQRINRLNEARYEANRRGQKADVAEIDKLLGEAWRGFQFAPQKSVLLPPEFVDTRYTGGMPGYIQPLIRPAPGTTASEMLTHFSHLPSLQVLDPTRYGTGIKGREMERLLGTQNPVMERSYAYTGDPSRVRPEPGLGRFRYGARSEGLYDLSADPMLFRPLATEANRTPFTAKANKGIANPTQAFTDVERMAKEYGYEGLMNPQQGTAIMYRPTPVQPFQTGGTVKKPAESMGDLAERYKVGGAVKKGIKNLVEKYASQAGKREATGMEEILESKQPPMTTPQGTGLPLMPRDQGMYTPGVEQKDLPRMANVDKARAKNVAPKYTERMQDLLDSSTARRKINKLIEKGEELGMREWYGTEPLRQVALNLGMSQEKFDELLAQLASASQRNPVDQQNRMGSYLWHLSQTGQLPEDSFLLTKKLQKEIAQKSGEMPEGTPIKLPEGYGSLAQGDIFERGAQIAKGDIEGALPPERKLGTFYRNLQGNLRPVTVDVNAVRGPVIEVGDPRWLVSKLVEKDEEGKKTAEYFPRQMFESKELTLKQAKDRPGFWEAAPAGSEYAGFEDLWQRGAKRFGVEPAEAQALGWYGSADVTALKTKPELYVDNLERLIRRTAEQTGRNPLRVMEDFITGKGFLYNKGGPVRRYAEGGAVNAAQYDPADIARRAASLMEEIDAA
jgi:hypothetical protein